MCGDHGSYNKFYIWCWGSPPHVRGPLSQKDFDKLGSGITPACAGTTQLKHRFRPLLRDHPRMCGDHVSIHN